MTPKEEYEARKAAKRRSREAMLQHDDDTGIVLDLLATLDRVAEAFERIAFALEGRTNG